MWHGMRDEDVMDFAFMSPAMFHAAQQLEQDRRLEQEAQHAVSMVEELRGMLREAGGGHELPLSISQDLTRAICHEAGVECHEQGRGISFGPGDPARIVAVVRRRMDVARVAQQARAAALEAAAAAEAQRVKRR